MRVRQVLSQKETAAVATVRSEATVREAVAALTEANIGALVVSDDGDTLAGIVSERDIVRRLHTDADVLDRPVADLMTAEVATTGPDTTVDELMSRMTSGRFRHMPVLDGDRLIGVVSIGDLVKARIDELEFERDQLGSYVQG